jgi:nucleoside-diphosphate-sugar epimerase
MSTAFVTGASGFIGGALTRRLTREGWTVRALARSERSAQKVRANEAEAVKGDLDDVGAMREGVAGCEVVFHCAAHLGEWGNPADFERGNVTGTVNALRAAKEAQVPRFVHVGTEAALMHGEPLVDVDESAPLRPDSKALYSRSKARAEQVVEVRCVPPPIHASRPRFAASASAGKIVVSPGPHTSRGRTTIAPPARAPTSTTSWRG